ncbi:MAG: hypothetical protein Q8K00_01860 [Syntrophales bacterium]|nr:hypothetical protein [Syntrophales bacterium]
MRLDLLKAIGPVPAIITVRKRKRGEGFPLTWVTAYLNHPFIFSHRFVPVLVSTLKSFINAIFLPSPATTKAGPFMLLPPRRRWKALSLRDCPCDKSLSRAADPSVPYLNLRHRCRPLAGGADQQLAFTTRHGIRCRETKAIEMTPIVIIGAFRILMIDFS